MGEDGLILVDDDEKKEVIDTETLAELLEICQEANKNISCVIFNACYGEFQAKEISNHIKYAIGMSNEIHDDHAICFAETFYQALFSKTTIETAFELGRNEIRRFVKNSNTLKRAKYDPAPDDIVASLSIPDHEIPQLIVNEELEDIYNLIKNQASEYNNFEEFEDKEVAKANELYNCLLGLGYHPQVTLFRQLINSYSLGAIVIHEPPYYGQEWLLNRLVNQYVPYFITGKKIIINLARTGRKNNISAIWRSIARGVFGKSTKIDCPEEISNGICSLLETKNVLLVFKYTHLLPKNYLNDLAQKFWTTLVEKITIKKPELTKNKLLMFLVDEEDIVCTWNLPSIRKFDEQWKPNFIIETPTLEEFSENDLHIWINTEYERLPLVLKGYPGNLVEKIIDESDGGIPENALDIICEICGFDLIEESEKWYKIR